MKALAFIVDLVVLGGLVFGTYALLGDTYMHGGILTKSLMMAGVGGVYGLLRPIYRKRLVPQEDDKQE